MEGDSGIKYENVVMLAENFNDYLKENPQTFVEFYSPHCGHCKHFAPEYEDFAKQIIADDAPFKITAVDCQQQGSVCEQQDIQGYPTLVFYYNGIRIDYDGPREGEAIKKFMETAVNAKPIALESLDKLEGAGLILFDATDSAEFGILAGLFPRLSVYHQKQ